MKKIGLIGGMSWESSLEYYRILNEEVKNKLGQLHSAECIMYSVDFQEIERLQHEHRWEDLAKKMIDVASRLKRAGADFIVICTNTMHKMADHIEREVGIKVLHIADAAGEKIIKKGIKKVGLLGTKFTMEGDFYKKRLNDKYNIQVVIPNERDREVVHNVIYNELCLGEIREYSKKKYIEIINKLAKEGAEGVILGCTEIPLLIKKEDVNIPVFDTTTIHGTAAVKFALNGDKSS
ncbi:aspartate/glutamate racemase family protein [Anaeromicrobium sediminis]|uniref:Aspartate racemase n=1 Tax=Anaeromicrobium sediminis TaxID=1478221 RepID=A0A267M904_9FIRM|nr:aspartate/glutamate racemase family protein [Anaeromicrobium sediminis]PAB55917.1 aspartate racemase [Anaeromicrobium sediminis]